MQESQTWRDYLNALLEDAHARQIIMTGVGVSSATLSRWINDISKPRPHNLQLIVRAIPEEHRQKFIALLLKEFPNFVEEKREINETHLSIPSSFYAQIFRENATIIPGQRFWTIADHVLKQALLQLDPYQEGMEITIVRCMPPHGDGKIYTMREIAGRGTGIWERDLRQRTMFLGAESLAGYVAASGHPRVLQRDDDGYNLFPAVWMPGEKSAACHPILRADRVAAALSVSSTQPDYFSPSRSALLQDYAALLSVIFDKEDFYDFKQLNLRFVKPLEEQRPYLARFGQIYAEITQNAARNSQHITMQQADQLAWEQIESMILSS